MIEMKSSRCGRLLILFTAVNSTSSGHQTDLHVSFPHPGSDVYSANLRENEQLVLKFLHLTIALLFNLAL